MRPINKTTASRRTGFRKIAASLTVTVLLTSVITIEGKEHKIAETIISNTATKDQKILTLDSMQTTTMADVKNGTTYISVMESD